MSRTRKPAKHRAGFVSIIGRPNAGKSTLLNAMVGQKIAIVANKPQTTRTIVQGVVTMPMAQIVFLDTPGIHKAETALNKRMMQSVREALQERDLLLFVIDATRGLTPTDARTVDMIKKAGTPTYAVFNKVDRVTEKPKVLELIEQYRALADFKEYYPVSGKTGVGLKELMEGIALDLPAGPALFPEDYLTDQPERFLAAELIRERVIRETEQEVPHSVAVLVEEWLEGPRMTRIMATIYVERDGQKPIIIGKQGSMLKHIGTEARLEIEKMLERKVFLELFVKVQDQWRDNPAFLNELDWRQMTGNSERTTED